MFVAPDFDDIVAAALAEDLGVLPAVFSAGGRLAEDLLARDVTSSAVIGQGATFSGAVVARQKCVVAGLPVAAAVFERLSEAAGLLDPVEVFPLVREGAHVAPGTRVLEVEGPAIAVLAAERTALDFLMMLSGIATRAAEWAEAAGPGLHVYDTRKTVPGLRALSKYAVRVGGARNHREGLFDMVLIKDNHLKRAGGITAAVAAARERNPHLEIEVEADTIEQAIEAVSAGADIVMLDNMDDATLARAVTAGRQESERLRKPVVFEASGGIGIDRLRGLHATGIDRVSSSALTMAPPVDFGLDESESAQE